MALKLKKTINAIDHDYWVVEGHADKHNKKTYLMLLLYTSEYARKNSKQSPVHRERFPLAMDGTGISDEKQYIFAKQSIITTEIKEENGKSVIIETETNPLANSEDLI